MASFDFEQAYDEHAWRIFGFFAHRLASRADAEDLTQLTFEKALAAWERFDPARASIVTWLFTIARNLLIDHYRLASDRPDRHISIDTLDPRSEPRVDGPEGDLGPSPELAAALAALSEREREVLALRFAADLSGPEIAAATGLSLANVQQICSRSLRKLQAELRADRRERPRPAIAAAAQSASGPAPAAAAAASASTSSPQAR